MRQGVIVTAAVIEHDGAFLLTRRLEGTHLAGLWEFPGGKCHAGESFEECLRREILEELDAAVVVGPHIHTTSFDYPDRRVELLFYSCQLLSQPRAALGQEMEWVTPERLRDYPMPPADDEVVQLLIARNA